MLKALVLKTEKPKAEAARDPKTAALHERVANLLLGYAAWLRRRAPRSTPTTAAPRNTSPSPSIIATIQRAPIM